MRALRLLPALTAAIATTHAFAGEPVDAVVIKTHVLTSDPAPDGNGTFSDFEGPFISGDGHIVFVAELLDTDNGVDDDIGVFRCTPEGAIVELMREGDPLTGGLTALDFSFQRIRIAHDGTIAIQPLVELGPFYGIFAQPVGTPVAEVAFPGVSPPGLPGTIINTQTFDKTLAASNAGVCFEAAVDTPPVETMLLVATLDPSLSVSHVFTEGDPSPDGYGVLIEASEATMNDNGQIAILSRASDPLELGTTRIVHRYDPLLGHTKVARQGELAPGSDRTFFFNSSNDDSVAISSAGHIAFATELVPPVSGPEEHGIFLWDGAGVSTIARTGQAGPNGGTFSQDVLPQFSLNGMGTVAFQARLSDLPLAGSTVPAIFRGDGEFLTEVIRVGDPVPDDPGSTFTNLSGPLLNDADDLLFLGRVSASATWSLWLQKAEGGMTRLLTWGDTFEVLPGDFRTTTSVSFFWPKSGIEGGAVAFNNDRQVALLASFTDGTRGILTAQLVGSCDADVVVDGVVDIQDLLALLSAWGACSEPCPPICPADVNVDCTVDIEDLLALLAAWGQCEP